MKLAYIYYSILAVLALAFGMYAFSGSETSVREFQHNDGHATVVYDFAGKESAIYKNWTVDTLTTTEKDTLALGFTLASPYQYCYQIYCKKLSGTPNLKIVLDQRNTLGNTDWLGCDSLSISGADSIRTYFALKGANTWGIQHRLRLVGTTGVNRYRITANLKKTVQ